MKHCPPVVVLPNGFRIQTMYDAEQLAEAVCNAIRWHYYDTLCCDPPDGHEGRGICESVVVAQLEACVPGDVERLKREASQWARLWHRDVAPDTWGEAERILLSEANKR